MKPNLSRYRVRNGFTLTETLVAMSIFVLVSAALILLLRSGLVLYTKNSAVNIAHQQARQALDRLEKDIHESMSLPVLIDADRNVVEGVGPAQGVSFIKQAGPICIVAADVSANQNKVQLSGLGAYVPQVGQRLLIPAYQIEGDITAVNGNSVTLATNLGVALKTSVNGNNANIVAYIGDLVSYVIVGSELRYYQNVDSDNYSVVSRFMTNPKPFGAPYYASE
jgi:prepilin-type N-terminal cleavage/methylation domain-containing protein